MKQLLYVLILYAYAPLLHADWNVLLYMDSSNNLSHAALKNITDLVHGYAQNPHHESVHVAIQLHCLPQEGTVGQQAYRYTVERNNLKLHEIVTLSYKPAKDFLDAAQWAFNKPAEHTMIILWGHGFGILNPSWSDDLSDWMPQEDVLMQSSCLLKRSRRNDKHKHHRALMLLTKPPVYMMVEDLACALDSIKYDILQGKKIDILGMDMCMMAMLEVGYELAPDVDYMIGSQDCEGVYGWDYGPIFKNLNSLYTQPAQVASSVINAYADFYTDFGVVGSYTQSAISLRHVQEVADNLENISSSMQACIATYGNSFVQTLRDIRKQLPRFCLVPMYTDLYTFYDRTQTMVSNFDQTEVIHTLMEHLEQGKMLIEKTVIAHCEGKKNSYAHGVSIYFPLSHIDASYYGTVFAKSSAWTSLMEALVRE